MIEVDKIDGMYRLDMRNYPESKKAFNYMQFRLGPNGEEILFYDMDLLNPIVIRLKEDEINTIKQELESGFIPLERYKKIFE
ncbi:MAG: hypothetical protein QXQ40_01255 [Candidatus Aenigmatarchaeota archaeon]